LTSITSLKTYIAEDAKQKQKNAPKALPTTGYGHHRCHRSKATDRFVLSGNSGINFLDVDTIERTSYPWIRGVCLYGLMPCNGLIYAPPHDCACYIEAKQYGFNALAAESKTARIPAKASEDARLERGPAFGRVDHAGARRGESASPAGTVGQGPAPKLSRHRDHARAGAWVLGGASGVAGRGCRGCVGGRLGRPDGDGFAGGSDRHRQADLCARARGELSGCGPQVDVRAPW